jgi:hypothetical protein
MSRARGCLSTHEAHATTSMAVRVDRSHSGEQRVSFQPTHRIGGGS